MLLPFFDILVPMVFTNGKSSLFQCTGQSIRKRAKTELYFYLKRTEASNIHNAGWMERKLKHNAVLLYIYCDTTPNTEDLFTRPER